MMMIILMSILLIVVFKITGLRVTMLMLFFVFLSKTWNYGLHNVSHNSQLEDYYSLFNLDINFKLAELQLAYDNEINKLNNNLSIGVEDRLHYMGLINTAFDTLNDPESKIEYNIKYNLLLDEINASKIKSDEINSNVAKYINELIKYNFSSFLNFKMFSIDTIGLLSCLLLDLVFLFGMNR